MANGKKKGNKEERVLCSFWKEWTTFDFTRVPASGGLRWKGMVNTTTSDLICADDKHSRRFQFSIECKSYKDIKFEHLILGNKSCDILKFWDQCCEDSKRGKKVPILFMRYNGMPRRTYYTIIPTWLYKLACNYGLEKGKNTVVKVDNPNYNFVIINSNDLLMINYLNFHKALKKYRLHEKKG